MRDGLPGREVAVSDLIPRCRRGAYSRAGTFSTTNSWYGPVAVRGPERGNDRWFLSKDPVLEFAEKKPPDPYAEFVTLWAMSTIPASLNPYIYATIMPYFILIHMADWQCTTVYQSMPDG